MGHLALVAYRRGDGSIRLHRAHRGADLHRRIGPQAPFGGPDPADPRRTVVDPKPVRCGADPADVLAAVDRTIELLVVVTPALDAATYLVCPIHFPVLDDAATNRHGEATDHDHEEATDPALRFVEGDGDPAPFRAWFVALRSHLSTAVGRDALAPATARRVLDAALAARGTVHGPDDPSFIRTA